MMKEIKRTPLVMMPDGRFLRGDEYVSEGVVVEEPPLYEKPQADEDQTSSQKEHHRDRSPGNSQGNRGAEAHCPEDLPGLRHGIGGK